MRISDWSSDVCSSDLVDVTPLANHVELHRLAQPPRRDAEFQGTRIVHLAAIDGQHDIARLEAGAIGRAAAIDGLAQPAAEIGRASCRERVCQYVSISVAAGSLKKKKTNNTTKTI